MAEERQGASAPKPGEAREARVQPGDRIARGESRSFDPAADAPTPRVGDSSPSAANEGHMGPRGDPAEGKR